MTQEKALVGIGECMIEFAPTGDGTYRSSFAGDVVNTLWYARGAPGWRCRFLSGVGTDPMSDAMVAFLEGNGIDCGLVRRIPNRRPGLYMIHLDGAERSFSYWRETSAARLLAADRAHLATAVAGAGAVYVSGITLAILSDDDRAALIAEMAGARDRGVPVAFDPNMRPALWPDTASMCAALTEAAAASSLVLPSYDDEARHFGDADPETTARRYGKGGALVVVKDGPGDVVTLCDGKLEWFPTPPVTSIVDTTGAGDSFAGAFLAAHLTGADLPAAVAAAQACAARVIAVRGALADF